MGLTFMLVQVWIYASEINGAALISIPDKLGQRNPKR